VACIVKHSGVLLSSVSRQRQVLESKLVCDSLYNAQSTLNLVQHDVLISYGTTTGWEFWSPTDQNVTAVLKALLQKGTDPRALSLY